MNEQDKQLLLIDLCGRLPYGVICDRLGKPKKLLTIAPSAVFSLQLDNGEYAAPCYTIEEAKPYLRPLSSMTKEEKKEYYELYYDAPQFKNGWRDTRYLEGLHVDWLNKNMFDYRRLISKGLALEAPKGMYKEE